MLDLIASLFVIGFSLIFSVTPVRFNLWLGRRFGSLVYYLAGKRRKITYANLKGAFYGEKTPRELKRITKEVYTTVGETAVELISMLRVDKKYVDKYIKIRDMDRIREAASNPNGMLLVSAHFGNWELGPVTSVIEGYPLHLVGRDQKMKRLSELLNKLREIKGNGVIRKGRDLKNIFRLLRSGKGIGLLADQNGGAMGAVVDLFGRPASTVTGPYRFAQKTGATILPAFMHRINGPYQELVLEPCMKVAEDEDIALYAEKFNKILEENVRRSPAHWFWMHKRWKRTPLKKIMVLDDGRKGHLKQSLSVYKQIKKYRSDEGFAPEHTQLINVRIVFKSKMRRNLFNLFSALFGAYCQGRMGMLKWALEKESYSAAINEYADVIVSCGSSLFGMNKILKVENYARNITVLDPGRLFRKGFDVIVVPRHDRDGKKEKQKKKTTYVVTDLAPNLIDPESIKKWAIDKGSRPCVGLLFGGDNPLYSFSKELTLSVAEQIIKASSAIGGCYYATTSRRTPEQSDEILRKSLAGGPECIGFVAGITDKDGYTVEKILATSDVMVVSGESISMVSEAVASGKPVIVFMPEKKTAKITKYEMFVRVLDEKGYIRFAAPEDISGAVAALVKGGAGRKLPDDDERIRSQMYRLF